MRLVDSIHRDKDVDKEIIFEALEAAMMSAARRQSEDEEEEEVAVNIDRETGAITVKAGEQELDPLALGRISAQTAKQIIIQRIREAERDVVFSDYESRIGEIVGGVIQRFEGSSIIVNLGKTEGILPRREQVNGENYRPGERIRVLVLDVKKLGPKVRISLSRTHPDLIKRLFELEVPEIADHTIEIRALAREPGTRSKIGVISNDMKVDCVGACVGVRGTRIKNIVDELNGEKIDIVRYSDSMDEFIANGLRPAEISSIYMDSTRKRAVVIVPEDQLALGIGKKGTNVRLASKLVAWDIDIHTADEFENRKEETKEYLTRIDGIDERLAAKLVESGIYSLEEFADSEPEMLATYETIDLEAVDTMQDRAVELIRERRKLKEEEKIAAAAAAAADKAAAEESARQSTEAEEATAEAEAPATEAETEAPTPEEAPAVEADSEPVAAAQTETDEPAEEASTEEAEAPADEEDEPAPQAKSEPAVDESEDSAEENGSDSSDVQAEASTTDSSEEQNTSESEEEPSAPAPESSNSDIASDEASVETESEAPTAAEDEAVENPEGQVSS